MFMSGDEMNTTHRCVDCRTLVNERLWNLLKAVAEELGISEQAAATNATFIAGGIKILAMSRDELRGKGNGQ